jgi:serine/threonine protein kinase
MGDDVPDSRLIAGRYWLQSVVGSGATSTVYRAHDEHLGREVALKLFHSGTHEPEREESEIAVLSRLSHHAIVDLLDAGIDQQGPDAHYRYLVMAFVPGMTLQLRIAQAPITSRHIAEIGYDLAEALEYIHSRGVIHRDIKPSNVLLVDYGSRLSRARAKLTDFGIALSEDADRLTHGGLTKGTAAYLSPEQASGTSVGSPSDVYSLGLVILESFTRKVEFPGSIVESAVARISRDPVIPRSLPSAWWKLLTAMTARDPSSRPTGRELISAFKTLVISESKRHSVVGEELISAETAPPPNAVPARMIDSLPDESLQRATAMAARILDTPIAIVSVVDNDRIWYKSYYGPGVEEIARTVDLSSPRTPLTAPVVVEDGRTDPRTRTSPLVTGPLGLRFYVGVPLKRPGQEPIGTLSVLGFTPGTASPADIANLEDIAALIVTELDTRKEGLRWRGTPASDMTESVPILPTPLSPN